MDTIKFSNLDSVFSFKLNIKELFAFLKTQDFLTFFIELIMSLT